MARRLAWSDVRGGVIASVAIVVVVVLTLTFSRVGALHGRTFRLYAIVGEARGLTRGSEVWLNGQKVGRVLDIRFRSPETADTTRRLEIDMEVLDRHRMALRRDAVAEIRPGGSVIGPPVVYLSRGTTRAGPLEPGDTVQARPQADVEGATVQFGAAAREFPVIINNVKVLTAQLQSTQGAVGALLNGPGLGELQRARIRASHVAGRLSGTGSAGSVGLIMRGDLGARAQRVMARADSVRALLGSPSTSLGRFRRDSSLTSEVADIRDELALVRRQLDESQGTAGRVLHDSALASSLGEAQRQMTLLFADLKAHPFRYFSF
jgi:phospholipid/cholesterol/gamma-HCH transport system substrate-binding protein